MPRFPYLLTTVLLCAFGCSDTAPPTASDAPDATVSRTAGDGAQTTGTSGAGPTPSANDPGAETVAPMEFKPLSLNGSNGDSNNATSVSGGSALQGEARLKAIMTKLKPLQVILGNWRGTTRKEYDGFKAVDNHEWIWDLQTDPKQPALAVKSDKSPYLKTARLTYNPDTSKFLLTAATADGAKRDYAGDFTEPVREIVGPDDKMHRVFRLELDETEESSQQSGKESWQIAFAQQENNRYLLEVAKRRGKAAFRRYDTVSTQREGTSFAINVSDYGEKECIISQGLGTIAVSYKGKSYWVCCSGCKAAFEEDPATWIARAEKRASEK